MAHIDFILNLPPSILLVIRGLVVKAQLCNLRVSGKIPASDHFFRIFFFSLKFFNKGIFSFSLSVNLYHFVSIISQIVVLLNTTFKKGDF